MDHESNTPDFRGIAKETVFCLMLRIVLTGIGMVLMLRFTENRVSPTVSALERL
jgi:hypothetical protein